MSTTTNETQSAEGEDKNIDIPSFWEIFEPSAAAFGVSINTSKLSPIGIEAGTGVFGITDGSSATFYVSNGTKYANPVPPDLRLFDAVIAGSVMTISTDGDSLDNEVGIGVTIPLHGGKNAISIHVVKERCAH